MQGGARGTRVDEGGVSDVVYDAPVGLERTARPARDDALQAVQGDERTEAVKKISAREYHAKRRSWKSTMDGRNESLLENVEMWMVLLSAKIEADPFTHPDAKARLARDLGALRALKGDGK